MGEPDWLDVFRDRLSGHVDAAVLDAAITEIRREFGGAKVYLNSGTQARHAAIWALLASGATVAEVARKFGLTVQAIGYIRNKKLSADKFS
jgi:Mor family transcriptional regulator